MSATKIAASFRVSLTVARPWCASMPRLRKAWKQGAHPCLSTGLSIHAAFEHITVVEGLNRRLLPLAMHETAPPNLQAAREPRSAFMRGDGGMRVSGASEGYLGAFPFTSEVIHSESPGTTGPSRLRSSVSHRREASMKGRPLVVAAAAIAAVDRVARVERRAGGR